MVGECKCQTNKLTIRIERSGKYVVRGGRIKDKKIIHARVCTYSTTMIAKLTHAGLSSAHTVAVQKRLAPTTTRPFLPPLAESERC